MKWALFYHSLLSDWNHGNAHFLRGVVRELVRRGDTVTVYEPEDGWSRRNLIQQHGAGVLDEVEQALGLQGLYQTYANGVPDLDRILDDVDVILVHEWNTPELVKAIGGYRAKRPDKMLFFHDTHHRGVSKPEEMDAYALEEYDGALVFGKALQRVYVDNAWSRSVWIWHEAADTSWFYPREEVVERSGMVWIGNWGDGERSRELETFLIKPVEQLDLKGTVYGVRYPVPALRRLQQAGLNYHDWLPNHLVPEVYARHRFTVHVPRRYYSTLLPGIPTIRPFEAMACGVPLICSEWEDSEGLFTAGEDFIQVRNTAEMMDAMYTFSTDERLATEFALRGLTTIREKHTCAHRVDELLDIIQTLKGMEALCSGVAGWGSLENVPHAVN